MIIKTNICNKLKIQLLVKIMMIFIITNIYIAILKIIDNNNDCNNKLLIYYHYEWNNVYNDALFLLSYK